MTASVALLYFHQHRLSICCIHEHTEVLTLLTSKHPPSNREGQKKSIHQNNTWERIRANTCQAPAFHPSVCYEPSIQNKEYKGAGGGCVCVFGFSSLCNRLFVTSWTVAHQACLSLGFPRQECWSWLPFRSPDPGIKPSSSAMTGSFFTTEPQRSQLCVII